jgi:hypothetical protein
MEEYNLETNLKLAADKIAQADALIITAGKNT